jgi:DNA-binding FadR family transcriptional regulator
VSEVRYLMTTRSPLYRQAQAAIKELIVDRGLRPGDPLPSEADLAKELGMSRLSLREGIKSLESMGIVSSKHGDGLFVAPFSFTPLVENLPYGQYLGGGELRHLLEVREALEGAVMERVVEVIDKARLDELERLAMSMGTTKDRSDSAQLDREFHETLMQPLDNPFITDLVNVFWIMFQRLRDVMPPAASSRSSLRDRHLAIVVALRGGDPVGARRAMIDHFTPLRKQLAAVDLSGRLV